MRPLEHFLSRLDKFENEGGELPAAAEEQIVRGFTDLVSPLIGREGARDLCSALLGGLRERPGPAGRSYAKLGYAAAFILGEFDGSMELDGGDWEEIRTTLEDAAGEMDIKTLTALMGELLERGKL
ncbi:MAG: hypothetical protein LBI94_00430 [Treponema sp.]|nr:hypothetical protein [Treponema sp.]